MAMQILSQWVRFVGDLIVNGKIREVTDGTETDDVATVGQLGGVTTSIDTKIVEALDSHFIATSAPLFGGDTLSNNPALGISLPLDEADTHANFTADKHHAGFVALKVGATTVDPDSNDKVTLVAGSNIVLTPGTNQITIAVSGSGGTLSTVEELDGAPSVANVTTLQFDQADGFVVSNPSGTIAKVKLSPAAHAAFIGLKKGATNVDPSSSRIELVEGANITITPNSPGAGQITIAASTGGGGSGTIDTVREVDGAPSISSPTVLEFDQADGFVVSNPSGSIAKVKLTQTLIGLKKGATNIDPASQRITLVEGSGITITANSPGSGDITIAASGGGGSGTLATVREVDGSPSVSSVDVLEFDQTKGFVVSNPTGNNARVSLNSFIFPTIVVKSADTSRTSTTTVTVDPDLKWDVNNGETWIFVIIINFLSGTTPDFKFDVLPDSGGAEGDIKGIAIWEDTTAFAPKMAVLGDFTTVVPVPDAASHAMLIAGSVIATAVTGNIGFGWAQNTSSGTATKVLKGSTLVAWRKT